MIHDSLKEGEGKVHGYLHTFYSRRREPIGLQRGRETDEGGGKMTDGITTLPTCNTLFLGVRYLIATRGSDRLEGFSISLLLMSDASAVSMSEICGAGQGCGAICGEGLSWGKAENETDDVQYVPYMEG